MAIESPGGGKRSDILAKFETGGTKTPRRAPSLFVPVDARKGKGAIVRDDMRPANLHFKQVGGRHALNATHHASRRIKGGVARGGLQVFEGDKKTVMIRTANGQGVILQRVGRGKRAGMRLLYTLIPKARIAPSLRFLETAQEAVTHFPEFFAARLREAMASAR